MRAAAGFTPEEFMLTCSNYTETIEPLVTSQDAGGAKISFPPAGSEGAGSGGGGGSGVLPLPLVPLDPPNPCRNWMEKCVFTL